MTNASYTLMAFGTGESYHMPKKNFLTQFYDACTTEKSYLDGPSLLGLEVKPNAKEGCRRIIEWLDTQNAENDLTVNLTGFSRGAVTCIHIANRLNRYKKALAAIPYDDRTSDEAIMLAKLEKLQLNLFIVDPVAGYTAKSDEDARVIPGNVSNYVSIVQLDEGRLDFKPQDMTRIIVEDPHKTRVAMLPMYGHHSASIKDKGLGMDSAADIVWSSLHSALSDNGSGYEKVPDMVNSNSKDEVTVEEKSNEALCDAFARHHAQRGNYAVESKKIILTDSLPTVRTPRKINQHLEFYVRDSDFFVNKLERELFKITYPKTFNYLFEGNKEDPRFSGSSKSSIADVHSEIEKIKNKSPELYKYLQVKGKVNCDGKLIAMAPEGAPVLESLSIVEMIYPNKSKEVKLDSEQMACSQELNKLEVLTQSIYRLTFQYQRERAVTDIFKKRAEDARAEQIRNEVLAIVQKGGDANSIKDKVLTVIYSHALDLRLEGSESQLLDFLDNTLEENGCESTSAPKCEEALRLIRAGFKLLDESIYFVATGGYIGGAVLSVAGEIAKKIGDRIMGLSINAQENGGQKINTTPREKVLSKIGEGFVALGTTLKTHFGLVSLREGVRSKISENRSAFFAKKLVAPDALLTAANNTSNSVGKRICAIDKALKQLGAVNGNSLAKDIERYNMLQEQKAILENKGFYSGIAQGVPGDMMVPIYHPLATDKPKHCSSPAA